MSKEKNYSSRVKAYLEAMAALERRAREQGVDITKYYTPNHEKKHGEGINHYFYLFCGHLADRQFMANVVKFYHNGSNTQQVLEDVLFGYDPKQTLACYNSSEALIQEINKRYPDKIKNTDKWTEYLTGIYQCADFLVNGEIGGMKLGFDDLLKEPKNLNELKVYLFKLRFIKNNICGVGVAVCYNWLKECGAVWLAKPDLHIKRIVGSLLKKEMKPEDYAEFESDDSDMTVFAVKLINKYMRLHPSLLRFPTAEGIKPSHKIILDEFTAVYMWEWAKEIRDCGADTKCTAFKLDRILYLFCTGGYFYMDDEQTDFSDEGFLNLLDEYE